MSVIDIRIDGLEELTVDIERLGRDASFKWPKEILNTSSEMMKNAIADEAVGSIKESVVVETAHEKRTVIVTSPHAIFVNDGTGPSVGRYVPAIGRRIKSGMHPGIRGSHFFERAIRMVTPNIIGFVHRKLNEFLFGG